MRVMLPVPMLPHSLRIMMEGWCVLFHHCHYRRWQGIKVHLTTWDIHISSHRICCPCTWTDLTGEVASLPAVRFQHLFAIKRTIEYLTQICTWGNAVSHSNPQNDFRVSRSYTWSHPSHHLGTTRTIPIPTSIKLSLMISIITSILYWSTNCSSSPHVQLHSTVFLKTNDSKVLPMLRFCCLLFPITGTEKKKHLHLSI